MSLIDYGVLVFVNSKLRTKALFEEMSESVGWVDAECASSLNHHFTAYIGDENATIAFYKTSIAWIDDLNPPNQDNALFNFNVVNFDNFSKKEKKWSINIGKSKCFVVRHNGYYILRWTYNQNNYKVYFGHGVDLYSYKNWGIVNYYRSFPYFFHNALRLSKSKWTDLFIDLKFFIRRLKYKIFK